MIRVSLTVLVFLYLLAVLSLIAAAWVADHWRRRRRVRRALQFRRRCAICGFEFEDPAADPLPLCPRCGRPGERAVPDAL